MRIKTKYIPNLRYIHILNPVMLGAIVCILFLWLVLSWWKVERQEGVVNIKFHTKEFNSLKEDVFIMVLTVAINSIWYHEERSKAYVQYLRAKKFPYYALDDWRTKKEIDRRYKAYLQTMNK